MCQSALFGKCVCENVCGVYVYGLIVIMECAQISGRTNGVE